MILIVGLGNPGLQYRSTYHNTGFAAVDKLAAGLGVTFRRRLCQAKVCECTVKGQQVVLAKPQTYMNLSGESVRELMKHYHVACEDVVIVYDDIELERGVLRMREHGSAGTHNGMRSVVGCVGENVVRLRVGVGRPTPPMELYDYVLSRPKGTCFAEWNAGTSRAATVLRAYIDTQSVSKALTAVQ